MNPININVHIKVGVTEELKGLLLSLIGSKPITATNDLKKESEKTAPAVEEPAETVEEPAPVAEEPEPAAEEPAPSAEESKKEFTEEDVRAAMDRTRKRIEGEDYKEKTDGEGRKKWHRQLTSWFKNTASVYGAEKPSALDSSDKREAFIKDCDAVIAEDDKLVTPTPF